MIKSGKPLIEPHTFGCGQASGGLLPAWRRLPLRATLVRGLVISGQKLDSGDTR
jgi:hypothetical protein